MELSKPYVYSIDISKSLFIGGIIFFGIVPVSKIWLFLHEPVNCYSADNKQDINA